MRREKHNVEQSTKIQKVFRINSEGGDTDSLDLDGVEVLEKDSGESERKPGIGRTVRSASDILPSTSGSSAGKTLSHSVDY